MKKVFLALVGATLSCAAAFAQPVTPDASGVVYVNGAAPAGGDGQSWLSAVTDLSQVLDAAGTDPLIKEIRVASGTYYPEASSRENTFLIARSGLRLLGGFDAATGARDVALNPTVLSGNIGAPGCADNHYHVVVIAGTSGDTVLLDGFTIRGGNANSTDTVWYNGKKGHSVNGGGVYAIHTGNTEIVINNCAIFKNRADYGGGVAVDAARIKITNSILANNKKSGVSGASYGGAFFAQHNAVARLLNCTITNNIVQNDGSATFVRNSDLTILNSILWGNKSVCSCPDSFKTIGEVNGNTLIDYSILEVINPASGSPSGSGALITTGSNVYNVDPQFQNIGNPPGADGLFHTDDDGLIIPLSSVAVNGGDPAIGSSDLGSVDFVNNPRFDGIVDIGAYEVPGTVTPVTLLSFNGSLQGRQANLIWTTATEMNFDHFSVEASADGRNYQSLGVVSATGNNSRYHFDYPQPAGRVLYRLKMVDIDGSFDYSKVVVLSREESIKADWSLYPNPVRNELQIRFENVEATDGRIVIANVAGQVVATQSYETIQPFAELTLNVAQLPNGIYWVTVVDHKNRTIGHATKLTKY